MSDSKSLAGRIERLERSNRRLRLLMLAFMTGCSIMATLGASSKDDQRIVEAESFVLRGKDGRIIAKLTSDPVAREPQLALYSNDGRHMLSIASSYIIYCDRDEEAVKNNLVYKKRISLKFNDENGFFAKVREPD